MKVEILNKNLADFTGVAWLVKKGRRYYVASGTDVLGNWEVLVFKCDKNGEVTNWLEVCGGEDMTHDEAIRELEALK